MSITLTEELRKVKKNNHKIRLAFLGVGWIGRNRMHSILKSGLAEAAIIADSFQPALDEIEKSFPDCHLTNNFDDIINSDIDGVVIATPNCLHAEQSIAALDKGLAVFCQKPLGRNFKETHEIIQTAKRNDKLLGVDLSYRYTEAYQKIFERIKSGEIGDIFSVNLVFHNAFGPGKDWFYNPELSGGGCVIDLGIHLIDLALHTLNFPAVKNISQKLYKKNKIISPGENAAEDFAIIRIDLENDVTLNLTCSWNLSLGGEAYIEASFYGSKGTASMKNVNNSYYNFSAEIFHGVYREVLSSSPDDWGGRAAINWINKLAADNSYDKSADFYINSAEVIDLIYGRKA